MTLPEQLAKVRDELADKYQSPGGDIDGCEYDAFRSGFNACYAHLSGMAASFNDQEMVKAIIPWIGTKNTWAQDGTKFEPGESYSYSAADMKLVRIGARWQHAQMAARVALAELLCKNGEAAHLAWMKAQDCIQQLERELAEERAK